MISSMRCSKMTLRWSFITSSNFRMFLRASKLRASTFCWAFSRALLIQGWTMASPSSGRASATWSPCARSRRCASGRLPATGRSASGPGRPDGPNGRAAGCRCGGFRGARWRSRTGRRRPAPVFLLRDLVVIFAMACIALRVASGRSASSVAMRISALPPSWMSVPRPAMLVAMVTAPGTPAWAMIWLPARDSGR
jgi:hypothetical protein